MTFVASGIRHEKFIQQWSKKERSKSFEDADATVMALSAHYLAFPLKNFSCFHTKTLKSDSEALVAGAGVKSAL